MDNEAIQKIADQIKAREEKAALSQRIQLHKADFIKANCPAFFSELADELKVAISQLNTALAGSASGDLPAGITTESRDSIRIFKEDFPSASTRITLNTNGLRIDFSSQSSQRKGVQPQHAASGCLAFDVNADNQLVILTKDQRVFSSAKEIAVLFMDGTFTIA
jgi:hypothetical protein